MVEPQWFGGARIRNNKASESYKHNQLQEHG